LAIEALRSKLLRIFDPQGIIMFPIRSLTPQQDTGNALATGFNRRRGIHRDVHGASRNTRGDYRFLDSAVHLCQPVIIGLTNKVFLSYTPRSKRSSY
jgi:hypothetical protein